MKPTSRRPRVRPTPTRSAPRPPRRTELKAKRPEPQRPGRSALTLTLAGKALAIVLLIASAWGAQQIVSSPNFQATSVLVSGSNLVPAEEIAATLGLSRPNVFHLRSRHLEALVETHPAIRQATVKPTLVGTVYVTVEERVPVLVWESNGRLALADAEGLALREVSPPLSEREEWRALPVVHATGGPVLVGGRIDPLAVQVVRAVTPALDSLGLSEGRLEYQPGAGVSVVGPAHRVTLGSADRIDAKLDAYRAIRRYLDETRTSAQLVDLRSPESPYFR